MNISKKHIGAETPREMSQAMDRLARMDQAEGAFGEAVDRSLSDEELEEVAGGEVPIVPTLGYASQGPRQEISSSVTAQKKSSQEIYKDWLQQKGVSSTVGQP